MDYINNYSGGATKREKEIVAILKGKYPELDANGLVKKDGSRFMKNKEEEARKYITDPKDIKLLNEYIKIFYERQENEGKPGPNKPPVKKKTPVKEPVKKKTPVKK